MKIRKLCGLQGHPEERTENINKLRKSMVEYKKAVKSYEDIPFSAEEERNYAAIKEHAARYYELTEQLAKDLAKNSLDENAKVLGFIIEDGEWNNLTVEFRKQIQANIDLFNDQSIQKNKFQQEERKAEALH